MTQAQKTNVIKSLSLEIGYYLTRLENHSEDGPERIGHCLGLMKLLGGTKEADAIYKQLAEMAENGRVADG